MEKVRINAIRRTLTGKQVKALRREGKLPAVLYGRHINPLPLLMDMKESSRNLEGLSSSALVYVEVEGEEHYALVREKQRNPLTGSIIHVDFQAVSLTEKVRTKVAIHMEGKSPAETQFGGILVVNLEEVEVECLPMSLPERINVNISSLLEIGDLLHVRDLVLPAEITVLEDLDEVVVVVTPPAVEEALEVEAAEGVEPDLVERSKRVEEVE